MLFDWCFLIDIILIQGLALSKGHEIIIATGVAILGQLVLLE